MTTQPARWGFTILRVSVASALADPVAYGLRRAGKEGE